MTLHVTIEHAENWRGVSGLRRLAQKTTFHFNVSMTYIRRDNAVQRHMCDELLPQEVCYETLDHSNLLNQDFCFEQGTLGAKALR